MEIFTNSAQDTQKLGEKIATYLIQQGSPAASLRIEGKAIVLALSGELGSGKTTFVQGLAKGLGLPHRLLSPTFIVSREYPLTGTIFEKLIHIDLYRIVKNTDFGDFGLDDIFANPAYLVVIEWAERLDKLPTSVIRITFETMADGRKISIKGINAL